MIVTAAVEFLILRYRNCNGTNIGDLSQQQKEIKEPNLGVNKIPIEKIPRVPLNT
jgi:hypothetical protein